MVIFTITKLKTLQRCNCRCLKKNGFTNQQHFPDDVLEPTYRTSLAKSPWHSFSNAQDMLCVFTTFTIY